MEQDLKKELEIIIDHLQCPKGFKCCQSMSILCKARQMDDGVASYLECLEEDSRGCVFSKHILTDDFYICSCPLRRYIADKKKSQK